MNKQHTSPISRSLPLILRFPPALGARGFTLIELLMVIAVSAVLLMVGIPSMAGVMKSIKLSSASNSFLSYLHLARSEAIKRNSRVALCKSADGLSCTPTGGWEQGFIVFHDANNNGMRDTGEAVIQCAEALPSRLRFSGN